MGSIIAKKIEIQSGFLFSASYQSLAFLLKLVGLPVKQEVSDEYLIGLICDE